MTITYTANIGPHITEICIEKAGRGAYDLRYDATIARRIDPDTWLLRCDLWSGLDGEWYYRPYIYRLDDASLRRYLRDWYIARRVLRDRPPFPDGYSSGCWGPRDRLPKRLAQRFAAAAPADASASVMIDEIMDADADAGAQT